MANYTFYEPDGHIRCQISCAERDLEHNLQDGCQYIEGTFDSRLYYVANGEAVAKQPLPAPTVANGEITGLPIPCKIIIEGSIYAVDDGHVVLNANLPGPYKVRILSAPYFDGEVTIP